MAKQNISVANSLKQGFVDEYLSNDITQIFMWHEENKEKFDPWSQISRNIVDAKYSHFSEEEKVLYASLLCYPRHNGTSRSAMQRAAMKINAQRAFNRC